MQNMKKYKLIKKNNINYQDGGAAAVEQKSVDERLAKITACMQRIRDLRLLIQKKPEQPLLPEPLLVQTSSSEQASSNVISKNYEDKYIKYKNKYLNLKARLSKH